LLSKQPESDLRAFGNPLIVLLFRFTSTENRSSGGKERLGSMSKQGDRYLRSLFVAGALAVIRYAKVHGTGHRPWLTAMLGRRPAKVAAIALANKIARMAKGERYEQPAALAR
jgi:transposase